MIHFTVWYTCVTMHVTTNLEAVPLHSLESLSEVLNRLWGSVSVLWWHQWAVGGHPHSLYMPCDEGYLSASCPKSVKPQSPLAQPILPLSLYKWSFHRPLLDHTWIPENYSKSYWNYFSLYCSQNSNVCLLLSSLFLEGEASLFRLAAYC